MCKKEFEDDMSVEKENDADTEYENFVHIKHEFGYYSQWEDCGGENNTIEIAICPECFKNELLPFLRSKGVTIDYRNCNW